MNLDGVGSANFQHSEIAHEIEEKSYILHHFYIKEIELDVPIPVLNAVQE